MAESSVCNHNLGVCAIPFKQLKQHKLKMWSGAGHRQQRQIACSSGN